MRIAARARGSYGRVTEEEACMLPEDSKRCSEEG
jgi:hypothetical protein